MRNAKAHYKTNICFDCTKAVGGCPWSARFEPVPGWTVRPITRSLGAIPNCPRGQLTDTYEITACPLFEDCRQGKAAAE